MRPLDPHMHTRTSCTRVYPRPKTRSNIKPAKAASNVQAEAAIRIEPKNEYVSFEEGTEDITEGRIEHIWIEVQMVVMLFFKSIKLLCIGKGLPDHDHDSIDHVGFDIFEVALGTILSMHIWRSTTVLDGRYFLSLINQPSNHVAMVGP